MSERRIAALVCEGPTDALVLEAMIAQLWPEVTEVRTLQPETDALGKARSGTAAGWTAVRTWCKQNGGRLAAIVDPDVGNRIDLLLIALDLDIAVEAGVAQRRRLATPYDATPLCRTIKSWLTTPIPSSVVIALPAMSVEAWVIAALYPKERSPEAIDAPAKYLVGKRKLRSSPADGKPWKSPRAYREFAKFVARRLPSIRKRCPEAERTCRKIEQRAAALALGRE